MNYRHAFRPFFAFVCAIGAACIFSCVAQAQDANTTLLLHFENSLVGAQGQVPAQAVGVSYAAGIIGRAAVFGSGAQLRYASAGSIDSTVGTLEFWINPQWSGNDNQSHNFVKFGDNGGGMLFAKDGANNLRSIFNQYGVGGQSEKGVAINVRNWQAGQWHHVAYTWSSAARLFRTLCGRQPRRAVLFHRNAPGRQQ